MSIQKLTEGQALKLLNQYSNNYVAQVESARRELAQHEKIVLDQWAECNAQFRVDDIIENCGFIIRVKYIYGRKRTYSGKGLFIEYRGPVLTRKLEPRKSGIMASIYADGRNIKLIDRKKL